MKIIVSPTKSLDFESKVPTKLHSQPRFLDQSKKLNTKLKTLSKKEIGNLMSVSEALSQLNYERNQNWETPFTKENAKQAVYSFTGAVFKGIDVTSLAEEKIPVLQDRLRILSGLYGILKPLDLIQPYRLEMGTKLKVDNTENLYKFWNNELADSLNEELKDDELLINLASAEYFRALPAKALKVPMITPVFKDLKNGQYKIVMTYAKKARGLMVRFIIENEINTIEQLKGFNVDNYRFSAEMSTETELLFTR
ncbi:MAG: peroxide stress protein YaaA [Polaribacter sp.]|jgi:cytoplasmic iron level regulating protein YaaA (DUF328/UPF0246 family)|tara:strand:- start:560 stop:1318 length:759 start_codon:yes stop_codon:yes gene_type:complete